MWTPCGRSRCSTPCHNTTRVMREACALQDNKHVVHISELTKKRTEKNRKDQETGRTTRRSTRSARRTKRKNPKEQPDFLADRKKTNSYALIGGRWTSCAAVLHQFVIDIKPTRCQLPHLKLCSAIPCIRCYHISILLQVLKLKAVSRSFQYFYDAT